MEGMGGQHSHCRRGHDRRCFTVAGEENLGSPVLVGRLHYYGSSGEHGFDLESTQIHLGSMVKSHFSIRQRNGASAFPDGLFLSTTTTAIMPYTSERIGSNYFRR